MPLVLAALLRYWYLLLASTVMVAAVAAIDPADDYESRARLLFKLGDDFLQTGIGPDARTTGRIQLAEAVNSEVQILTSYDVLAEVVEALGSDFFIDPAAVLDVPREEAAVSALRNGLNVRSVENSAVVHLGFTHVDPDKAQTALVSLIDVYFRVRESLLNDGESNVIAELADEARTTFVEAERAYENYLRNGDTRDPGAALELLRNQRASLAGRRLETRQALEEDEQKLAIIEAEIADQPTEKAIYSESHASDAAERARSRLLELRVDEKQLLGKFTPSSRAVVRVRTEIEELERLLASEGGRRSLAIQRTGTNPIRDTLELQQAELKVRVAGARARLASLDEQIETIRQDLSGLEQRQFDGNRLFDDMTLARTRLRDIEDQHLQQRLLTETLAVRRTSVRVIETPSLPRVEAGLGTRDRVVLGAIIGALVGAILAVWIELYRRSARSAQLSPSATRRERPYPSADQGSGFARTEGRQLALIGPSGTELVHVRQDPRPSDARAEAGQTVPLLGEFRRVS